MNNEKKRPTWIELKEQAPRLCEAVIGWIREQAHGYALGELLRGKTIDGRPIMADFARGEWRQFNHPHDPQRPGAQLVQRLRLRAAEYRMEAEVAHLLSKRAISSVYESGWAVVAMRAKEARTLADALDAAADEAERLAGGGT